MIKKLKIENFAIIEDVEIEFFDKMTVLIGETGAGKSLIIDSINLLLGARANQEMIRTGATYAKITGVFTSNNMYLQALLDKLGIKYLSNSLEITRTINLENRNIVKINNQNVSLQDLKEVAKYLADIHVQNDANRLINPENYLMIIDGFNQQIINDSLAIYQNDLKEYRKALNEYQNIIKTKKDIDEKIDLYQYQLKELKRLDLKEGELESLQNEAQTLKNFDKVYSILEEICKNFDDYDPLTVLFNTVKNLDRLGEYTSEFKEVSESLKDKVYDIDDAYSTINKKFRSLDFDPQELDSIISRISELEQAQKKYGKNIKELIEYQSYLVSACDTKENFEFLIDEATKKVKKCYSKTQKSAQNISKVRKEIGKQVEAELEKVLTDLLLKAKFLIDFKEIKFDDPFNASIFHDDGIDIIDFLISTNVGEEVKPLSKTVSGGEMSRIMLGLKTILLKSQKISTIVFDEIDSGLSGLAASKVAQKIKEISLQTQVLTITHLPQVAAVSNHQFLILKQEINGRTYTKISNLNFDEFVYQVASMISGDKITDSQIESAKALILN